MTPLQVVHALVLVVTTSAAGVGPVVPAFAEEAERLRALATTDAARAWLDQAARLPAVAPRTIYIGRRPSRAHDGASYERLSEAAREGLRAYDVTPARYYATFYGTPLAYLRAIDLAGAAVDRAWAGARVLDLGYGQLGQLRMLAQCGAVVTGVDVDPVLSALYRDADGATEGGGSVRVLECAWPNDEACRDRVGRGYDVIISRNLLKRGYVKPATPNPHHPAVGAGMSDAEVVGHFYDALAPGGVLVIYNIGGEPDPSKPWTDIATPWSRETFERAGFEVLEFDADESAAARRVGDLLGWDDDGMDLAGLRGVRTVVRRAGA